MATPSGLDVIFTNGALELQFHVPGLLYPGILRYGNLEIIHQRLPQRLGVDADKPGLGIEFAHYPSSVAGVDQIVDHQKTLAITGRLFEHPQIPLPVVVITGDTEGIHVTDAQLAGQHRRRDQAATGDGDDAFPLAGRSYNFV